MKRLKKFSVMVAAIFGAAFGVFADANLAFDAGGGTSWSMIVRQTGGSGSGGDAPVEGSTTLYVDAETGSDVNSGTSESSAKATIQAAIDAAPEGSTILVAPGTYAPVFSDNRRLTIKSTQGASVTVIDGGNVQRCVQACPYDIYATDPSNIYTNTVIDGFSLVNGNVTATDYYQTYGGCGGGLYGGIAKNCLFKNNTARGGGGADSCILYNCLFFENSAQYNGGGAEASLAYNCTFTGNCANDGGGGVCNCTIFNSITYGNTARYNEDVFSFRFNDHLDTVAERCGFTRGESYACVTDDPCFANAANHDYSLAENSPCINVGDNSYVFTEEDFAGNQRISEGTVDIGCYEYVTPISGNTVTVTFNANGGSVSPATKSVSSGAAIRVLPMASRSGYQFDGWWTAPNGGVSISANTVVTDDVTYYAHWSVSPYEWTYTSGTGSRLTITGVSPQPTGLVKLPVALDGMPVIALGDNLFYHNNDIEAVIVPQGVQQIGVGTLQNGYSQTFEMSSSSEQALSDVFLPPSMVRVPGAFTFRFFRGAVLHMAVDGSSLSFHDYAFANFYGSLDVTALGPVPANMIKYGLYHWNYDPYGGQTTYRCKRAYKEEWDAFFAGTDATFLGYLDDDYAYSDPVVVTFNANGGGADKRGARVYGTPVGNLPIPEREGYSFLGWYTAKNGGEKISSSTVVTEDVTYYAQWAECGSLEKSEFGLAISYYRGGSAAALDALPLDSTTAYYDVVSFFSSRVPALTASTASIGSTLAFGSSWENNCRFHGEFCGNADYFWAYMRGSIQIDEAGDYEFGYNVDDGCALFIDGRNVVAGSNGYYTYMSGTIALEPGLHDIIIVFCDYNSRQALDVYMKAPSAALKISLPQFILSNPGIKTITFNANGGTVDEVERNVVCGEAIGELPVLERTGYTFKGWFTAPSGGTRFAETGKVANDRTLYAQWTANRYTIAYNANGGSGEMAGTDAAYDSEAMVASNGFARVGHRFVGWATASDGDVVYAAGDAVLNLTAQAGDVVTLYAVWVPVYTLVFHRNDANDGKVEEYEFDYGVETRLPSLNKLGWARRGFDFLGWATSEANAAIGVVWKKDWAVVSTAAEIGETIDVWAAWKLKDDSYAVQFVRNDGAGTWRTVGFTYGTKTRIPSLANGLGWARRGYNFKGWALTTVDAAAGKVWKADWSYVATAAAKGKTLTVYAVWELKPGFYQIRFNKNDGTTKWRSLGFAVDASTKLSTIKGLGWERAGYTFKGWASSKANADAKKVWKTDGATVKNAAAEGKTLSIYAIWE